MEYMEQSATELVNPSEIVMQTTFTSLRVLLRPASSLAVSIGLMFAGVGAVHAMPGPLPGGLGPLGPGILGPGPKMRPGVLGPGARGVLPRPGVRGVGPGPGALPGPVRRPRLGPPGPGPVGPWFPLLPVGAIVSIIAGVPYYVYENTYYVEEGSGYRVVSRPREEYVVSDPGPAPVVAAAPAPVVSPQPAPVYEQRERAGQLYAYPRNGQSETTATYDRIECESWGGRQTGYLPGQSAPNPERRSDYQRAVAACLEARGYTVR